MSIQEYPHVIRSDVETAKKTKKHGLERTTKKGRKRKRRDRESDFSLYQSVEKPEDFLLRKRSHEDHDQAPFYEDAKQEGGEESSERTTKKHRKEAKTVTRPEASDPFLNGLSAGTEERGCVIAAHGEEELEVEEPRNDEVSARKFDPKAPSLGIIGNRVLEECPPEAAHSTSKREEKRIAKEQRKKEKAARKARKRLGSTSEATHPFSDHPDISCGSSIQRHEKKPISRRRAEKLAIEAHRLSLQGAAPSEAQNAATKPVNVVHHASYTEAPSLTNTTQSEIDDFLSDSSLSITDTQSLPLRPILSFDHLPSTNLLCHYVLEKFRRPTAIQSSSWPYAFAGRDVIGVAETGSGKTLGFGLPLARHIVKRLQAGENSSKVKRSPLALVVSPTRELALQIHEQLAKLGASNAFNVAAVYGGVAKEQQTPQLRKAHCCVATPGRLRDYMQEPQHQGKGIVYGDKLDLSRVRFVVLDEADRMLDTGFEEDIRAVLGACARVEHRQTLMFTATWPQSVRSIANEFMKDPVKITIGDRDELRANDKIQQVVEVIEPRHKNMRLRELLEKHTRGTRKNDRILVFALYKKEAARVEDFVRGQGFRVTGIHGDMSQQKRMESLEAFKSGRVPVLVATDVAARGLDIPAVKLVINVTFPLTVEDYVHRIGRTGRAGQDGLAVTLFTDNEKALAGGLINVLKAAKQEVPEDLLKFGTTVKTKAHDVYGRFVKQNTQGQVGTKITFE